MRVLQRSVLVVLAVVGLAFPSAAQDDIDKLLTESVDDAEKLIGAYISPVMKGLSLSLNQGWYNTAKAHKIAGVDLTITVNAMTIPDAERMFNPGSLNLSQIELVNGSPGYPNAPTMAGPEDSPVFRVQGETATFEGPPGLGLKENIPGGRLPVPMAHLAFGLPKGTDVKIRFSPELTFGDETTFKLFGIGVMHDIKQWIPGIKLLPFDLSGFVGYTKLQLNSQLDADTPGNEDQKGVFSINATTIQGVMSKKFSVVTFYGGLGYNIAKSNLALKGTYNIGDETDPELVRDPVDLNFAASGFRGTAGMRLKLAVFTFHADYTLQKYNCLTVGFGISVR